MLKLWVPNQKTTSIVMCTNEPRTKENHFRLYDVAVNPQQQKTQCDVAVNSQPKDKFHFML